MEWQPIETAPKDGTEVLLHGPTPLGSYMEVCRYYRGKNTECWPIIFMHDHGEPTHWMPLPDPPA